MTVALRNVFLHLEFYVDTVGHDILLSKLEKYGIQGNNLQWFRSYLSDGKQFIKYSILNTTFNNIIRCVPQGSVPETLHGPVPMLQN